MRIMASTCLAAITAMAAPAQAARLAVDLLPGHPIYHESAQEAGVVMAVSITPGDSQVADLKGLCEELRVTAGLARDNDNVPLEVIFVVPYKGMAIEGYYLRADAASGSETLVRGNDIDRAKLDGIVARAGIPARILDETKVEHEISCELNKPTWLLRWEDIRPVEGERPDAVIESARQRFMAIHRSIIEHTTGSARAASVEPLGLSGTVPSLGFSHDAPAPAALRRDAAD